MRKNVLLIYCTPREFSSHSFSILLIHCSTTVYWLALSPAHPQCVSMIKHYSPIWLNFTYSTAEAGRDGSLYMNSDRPPFLLKTFFITSRFL